MMILLLEMPALSSPKNQIAEGKIRIWLNIYGEN